MPTVPRMLQRRANRVELHIPKNRDVVSYEVQAADTLDNAFSGATAMFSVGEGADFRSYTIHQRKWGILDESRRGTRIMYDPADYVGGANLPIDAHTSFVRVVETSQGGVVRSAGPILVVPPRDYLTTSRPTVGVSGTAPNVGATPSGVPPVVAMHFTLPKYSDGVRINNLGSSVLLISFNEGMPEFAVPANTIETIQDAHISDIFVHVDGGTSAFTMHFSLVNGLQE